ncbi:MAG: hypothetical protein ACLFR7_04365 [Opitutales bacterium]
MRRSVAIRGLLATGLALLGADRLGGAIILRQVLPEGVLELPLPGPEEGWEKAAPESPGDLLFAEGVTLAWLRQEGMDGVMVTVSLDEGAPLSPAAQAEFLALARRRAAEGRMELWDLAEHLWIVQEFRSPSERVLATQTFAGPYTLAYVFWLPPQGEEALQESHVREFLTRWAPRWSPAGLIEEDPPPRPPLPSAGE